MKVDNFEEFDRWVNGISKGSRKQYKSTLTHFCKYTGLNPKELVDEAEAELRKPRRERGKPQERLIAFFKYLTEEYVPTKGRNAREKRPGMSPAVAKTKVIHLRGFYRDNGFQITSLKLPKVAHRRENRRVEFSIKDIRSMVEAAPSWRDRSLILFGFQGGFDVDTVVKLNLGDFQDKDLEKLLENKLPQTPILLPVVREKEGIDYHTCLGFDAVDSFRAYLQERKARGEELTLESPAFVKEGSKVYSQQRIDQALVYALMRKVPVKAGVISRERLERADFNIAGYHALRATFSRRMEYAGFPTAYIDYSQGHTLPHGGAYRRPNPRKLLEKYKEHEEALSISKAPKSVTDLEEELKEERAHIREQDKRLQRVEKKLEALVALEQHMVKEQGV